MMYLYETHLHTSPASACAKADVSTTLQFYKEAGYDGIFITNHFINGNCGCDKKAPYQEQLDFYFADYLEALRLSKSVGIKVFLGVEVSYKGTDFLLYGLPMEWYYQNQEIMELKMSESLCKVRDAGGLVIQAHPFREASYIDHIRLFPRAVQGVESLNACRIDFENELAHRYACSYGLMETAGSDNHVAGKAKRLAGMCCETPLDSELDFIQALQEHRLSFFSRTLPQEEE